MNESYYYFSCMLFLLLVSFFCFVLFSAYIGVSPAGLKAPTLTVQKFLGSVKIFNVLKEMSYTHQGCIYLIKQ